MKMIRMAMVAAAMVMSAGVAMAQSEAEALTVPANLSAKLSSKNAKVGDAVVLKTTGGVKFADGTKLPSGTKLVGKVVGGGPRAGGDPGRLAVQFDHAEMKGGVTLPLHVTLQAVSRPADADDPNRPPPSLNRSAGGDGVATTDMMRRAKHPIAPTTPGTINNALFGISVGNQENGVILFVCADKDAELAQETQFLMSVSK